MTDARSHYGATATAIVQALQVLVLCENTRAWLQQNDPKALQQATTALDAAGFKSEPDRGPQDGPLWRRRDGSIPND